MSYQIGEVAKLAKISIRMLRHYDQIGLLQPSGRTEGGYRLYSHADLQRLQQIQFYRALDFPLSRIQALMTADNFDRQGALLQQRQLLQEKSAQLDKVLELIDRVINHAKEEQMMELKDMFDAFPELTPELMEEGEKAWGHTEAYQESSRRIKGYDKQDWQQMRSETDAINARLEAVFTAGTAPDHADAVEAVDAARLLIDRWFFPCPRQLHAAITAGNSQDERFVKNIDVRCPGLALWISQAAAANLAQHPG